MRGLSPTGFHLSPVPFKSDREWTNPKASLFNDHNRSILERMFHLGKVLDEKTK
jgi:hypothetical protein